MTREQTNPTKLQHQPPAEVTPEVDELCSILAQAVERITKDPKHNTGKQQ